MKCTVSKITRFIDGDSFEASVFWQGVPSKPFGVRVQGIDCPELRGKCQYERALCRVFGDGVSLRRALINAGLAKAYEGHKRQWC